MILYKFIVDIELIFRNNYLFESKKYNFILRNIFLFGNSNLTFGKKIKVNFNYFISKTCFDRYILILIDPNH